jgi:hypothetical protein
MFNGYLAPLRTSRSWFRAMSVATFGDIATFRSFQMKWMVISSEVDQNARCHGGRRTLGWRVLRRPKRSAMTSIRETLGLS